MIIHKPLVDQPIHSLTFEEVMDVCQKAATLLGSFKPWIWGVPRNGMIIAGLLAHCNPEIKLASSPGPGVIIVDDIHDTGQTLLPYSAATTLTLFWRRKEESAPSMWVEIIKDNTWIVFPWEK